MGLSGADEMQIKDFGFYIFYIYTYVFTQFVVLFSR